jgi:hypothetical protein
MLKKVEHLRLDANEIRRALQLAPIGVEGTIIK